MLGENIKKAREARGMTQQELAEELNVVRQTVSKWEKNLSVPDADLLNKISIILGVDIKILLNSDCDNEHQKENVHMNKILKILLIIGFVFLVAVLTFFVCNVLQLNIGIIESTEKVFVTPI